MRSSGDTLSRISTSCPVLRYHQRKVTVDQYFSSTYIAGAYKRLLARKAVAKLRLKYASSISAQGPTE